MALTAPPPAAGQHAGAEPVVLDDPRPARRQAFALTPLADVMFQLLIFFMLSSSLSPYALLPLAAPGDARAAAAAPPDSPAQDGAERRSVIWQVGRGEIRMGAERLAPDALAAALARLASAGTQEILLITTPEATTQDVATALEAIRVSRLPRVRLVGRAGG